MTAKQAKLGWRIIQIYGTWVVVSWVYYEWLYAATAPHKVNCKGKYLPTVSDCLDKSDPFKSLFAGVFVSNFYEFAS